MKTFRDYTEAYNVSERRNQTGSTKGKLSKKLDSLSLAYRNDSLYGMLYTKYQG